MAHCCVVFCHFCTNDWRYKDEYRERTGKELHCHQFPAAMRVLDFRPVASFPNHSTREAKLRANFALFEAL